MNQTKDYVIINIDEDLPPCPPPQHSNEIIRQHVRELRTKYSRSQSYTALLELSEKCFCDVFKSHWYEISPKMVFRELCFI